MFNRNNKIQLNDLKEILNTDKIFKTKFQKIINIDGIDKEDEIPINDYELENMHKDMEEINHPIFKKFRKDELPNLPKRLQNSRVLNQKTQKKTLNALIPYNENPIILSFLGAGYPLLFEFIKYCIYILISLLLITGSYNIFSNVLLGKDCIDRNLNEDLTDICIRDYISIFTLANKRNDKSGLIFLQQFLNLLSILFIILLFQYMRKSIRDMCKKIDHQILNVQDFSIMVENIPKKLDCQNIEYQISQFFNNIPVSNDYKEYNRIQYDKFEVTDISLGLDLHSIEEMIQEKEKIINKYRAAMKERLKEKSDQRSDKEKEILKEWQQMESNIDNYSKKLSGQETNNQEINDNFTGTCFIQFVESEMVNEIISRFEQTHYLFGLIKTQKEKLEFPENSGNFIRISHPSHPNDINWKNLIYNDTDRLKRSILMNIAFYLMVISCFFSILFFKVQISKQNSQWETELDKDEWNIDQIKDLYNNMQVYIYVIPIIIIILNLIVSIMIPIMTSTRKLLTKTHDLFENSMQLSVAQFLNGSIAGFITSIVMPRYCIGTNQCGAEIASVKIYEMGGLIQTQHNIILQTIVLSFILPLILDTSYWTQWILRKVYIFLGMDKTMKRSEIQQLYKYPAYQMGSTYGKILNIMFTTCFYAPLIPMSLIYALIGMMIFYWVNKIQIIRWRSININFSSKIVQEMIELLEILLPLYAFSNIVWEKFLIQEEKITVYAIIGIVIGILHAILPMEDINQLLNEYSDNVPEINMNYYESFQYFDTDYNIENPATNEFYNEDKIQEMQQEYIKKSKDYESRRIINQYVDN